MFERHSFCVEHQTGTQTTTCPLTTLNVGSRCCWMCQIIVCHSPRQECPFRDNQNKSTTEEEPFKQNLCGSNCHHPLFFRQAAMNKGHWKRVVCPIDSPRRVCRIEDSFLLVFNHQPPTLFHPSQTQRDAQQKNCPFFNSLTIKHHHPKRVPPHPTPPSDLDKEMALEYNTNRGKPKTIRVT